MSLGSTIGLTLTNCARNLDLSKPGLRPDIQALRGFAVLVVLFFHAKLGSLPAGYLGVDVFFLLSGSLITQLIKRGIERDEFSFAAFYVRRARRLLPAAYVTFAITALLAPLFLTSTELGNFREQLAGAIGFVANIGLWKQTGYFEGASELKPLLHIWSLSLEEQYYFVVPALMVWLPSRYWKAAATITLIVSLALCLYLVREKATATFYLRPTRAWEFAIGSIGALVSVDGLMQTALKGLFWPAIGLLLLPIVTLVNVHPGPDALLICLATIVVILRNHPALQSGRLVRGLASVGTISYSLYLVHWPIFAFLNNAWIAGYGTTAPVAWRVALVLLSLVAGFLMHRYVETPFRTVKIRGKRTAGIMMVAAIPLVLVAFSASGLLQPSDKTYGKLRRTNYGLSDQCESIGRFKAIPACQTAPMPVMLVWGDSFAMHLVPGLVDSSKPAPRLTQATRSWCSPLLGVASVDAAGQGIHDLAWAKSCVAFNDSVVEFIERTPSIRLVVLSSPLTQFVDQPSVRLLHRDASGSFSTISAGPGHAITGLAATVARLRAMGRKVVFVAAPPVGSFDIGRCMERLEEGLPITGASADCSISMQSYQLARRHGNDILHAIPTGADVDVIDFDDYLCRLGSCATYVDGTFIYGQGGHLSYEGSRLLAATTSLLQQIRDRSR